MDKKLIMGNWKMNPSTLTEAKKLFLAISSLVKSSKETKVVICPPAIYLAELSKLGKKITLGAQDSFYETKGAFTGSLSPLMLKSAGAEYVIIGHSERRREGETDEQINKKIKMAIKSGLTVVLCVGEKEHDENGDFLSVLKNQLEADLFGLTKKNLENLIIAHEPIWAIGEKAIMADTPDNFQHNRLFIKKIVSGLVPGGKVLPVPVIYGGSVNKKNALDFLQKGEADGLLVGRESLNPKNFGEIINAGNQ